MVKVIITIGRQFGSGGREVGRKVASSLGIPFYDKQLIRMAAEGIAGNSGERKRAERTVS